MANAGIGRIGPTQPESVGLGGGPGGGEFGVPAIEGEELVVRTELDEFPCVDDRNPVCTLNCREPVCDNDGGSSPHQ